MINSTLGEFVTLREGIIINPVIMLILTYLDDKIYFIKPNLDL